MIYLVCLLISIVLYFHAPTSMSRPFMTTCVLLALAQTVWFVYATNKVGQYRLGKILFRHSVVFVGIFLIVFYQYDIDYILGLTDNFNPFIWYDTKVVCKCLTISNMALSALFCGYRLYQNYEKKVPYKPLQAYRNEDKRILSYIIAFSLLVYIIMVPKEYLAYGYIEHRQQGAFAAIIHILAAAFIAAFAIYSYGYRHSENFIKGKWKKYFVFPIAMSCIYAVVVLLTGRRTEVVRLMSLLLIVYCYILGFKVKNRRIIIAGIAGIVLLAGMALLREGTTDSLSASAQSIAKESSISPFTQELASSVGTLHLAVSNFPSRFDYVPAAFFIRFFTIIPGANSLLGSFFPREIESEYLFTEIAGTSWGVGSSITADLYISFGPIGIIIFFILLGYFLRYLEIGTFCKDSGPYFLVLSFCCYSQFAYACRGAAFYLFNGFLYAAFFLFLVYRKRKKVL